MHIGLLKGIVLLNNYQIFHNHQQYMLEKSCVVIHVFEATQSNHPSLLLP